MPKIVKRLLLGLVILIILFVTALAAIPYFFKDELIAELEKVVNEQIDATVDLGEVDLSLLRDFPNVSLQTKGFSVVGKNEFDGIPLVKGESFDVSVDFWSAWNFGTVPLEIREVNLVKPEVRAIVLPNGKANYDIAKSSEAETETTESTPFEIKLSSYSITDGYLLADDRQGDFYAELIAINHSGEGDFNQDVFELGTKTDIESFTAKAGGITYLKDAQMKLGAGFLIDLPNSKYTLLENELKINDLEVNADGWLAAKADGSIDMEIDFNSPGSNFKSLLSMIPNAYIEGYEDVKATGDFSLAGSAKGKFWTEKEIYPAFDLDLKVNNADIKYPDLPMGISGINTDVKVNSPSSDLDKMLVDVSKFKMNIGKNPIEGFFKLRTPLSDPDVDTKIKGLLNLGDLARAFPMEGVKTLDGLIDMDLLARTKLSTIDRADYENVDMSGNASIENLDYVADGLPAVRIGSMRMFFTPQNVQVPNFDMRLGKSDMRGEGKIDNILAYFSPNKTMKGDFKIRSNYFNADEWITEESTESTVATPQAAPATDEELFNRFDFTVDGAIGKMDYDVYQLTDLKAKGHFTPNKLTASNLSGKIGESDFAVSGVLTNVWNYVFNNETLGGNLKMKSRYMNLNQFMTEGEAPAETAPATAEEPILVPAGMDIKMTADLDKVIYDNMELRNVNGGLTVANEAVTFDDVIANSLGGQMAIRGGYDTKDHDKPVFDMDMQMQNIDFEQAFNTFNTFQAVAPIGKFIEGKFNTKLGLNSSLGKDLMPDLSTLSMDGMLHTLDGAIKNFKPLEEIGNKLNVDAFKSITIKNTKNWFEVLDGKLLLKEFDYQYQDIPMKIGGGHAISGGSMDYNIVAKIPRDKIGKNPLGAAANSGLELLGSQASKLGVNLNAGEYVNVSINIGGTMADPKIGVKLLGTEGESSVKEAIADQAKKEAENALAKAKAEAEARAEARKKELEAQAKKEAEKIADKAKEEAKEKINDKAGEVVNEVEKKVKDKVGDEVKKELDKWNPFGKKKKGGG